MKKIIVLYIFMILAIAGLAFLMNMHWESLSFINFPYKLHLAIEGTNSILMFLIFLAANNAYSKTKDERLVILAGGYLIGAIFNCMHIIMSTAFPYDLLSLDNIKNHPNIIYLLMCNLILPLAIYFALMHKPSQPHIDNFRLKVYSIYFLIFMGLISFPFFTHHFSLELIYKFNLILHALEFINYSLYIMLAFIVINIRQGSNLTFFPVFTTGLVISGLGGLFYLDPNILPLNGILAHVFEAVGLVFILAGINHFQAYAKFLRFKDELVAYLCLMFIAFYIVFVSIASIVFHIVFPSFSAFIFLEFILIFQFIVYLISNKLTQPLTRIIEYLNKYNPGDEPVIIPVIRRDEIGMLAEKINTAAILSWQRILEVSKIAERESSIRRVFEAMRRVSDQNIIKNTIIDEISRTLHPDKCIISLYDSVNNIFYFDKYLENLPSRVLANFDEVSEDELKFQEFYEIFKNDMEVCFANLEEYITKNSLKGTPTEKFLRENNIKSCCSIPIYYANNLLGFVILEYTKSYKELSEDELMFLKTMVTQIAIAIH